MHTLFSNYHFKVYSCFLVVFLTAFCEKDIDYDIIAPPYAGIERTIRNKYDTFAVFPWTDVILPADAYCFSGIYLLKGKLAG